MSVPTKGNQPCPNERISESATNTRNAPVAALAIPRAAASATETAIQAADMPNRSTKRPNPMTASAEMTVPAA